MTVKIPIAINSDCGRIGPLVWVNSSTMPTFDPLCCCITRRWGGIGWNPDPSRYLPCEEVIAE